MRSTPYHRRYIPRPYLPGARSVQPRAAANNELERKDHSHTTCRRCDCLEEDHRFAAAVTETGTTVLNGDRAQPRWGLTATRRSYLCARSVRETQAMRAYHSLDDHCGWHLTNPTSWTRKNRSTEPPPISPATETGVDKYAATPQKRREQSPPSTNSEHLHFWRRYWPPADREKCSSFRQPYRGEEKNKLSIYLPGPPPTGQTLFSAERTHLQ
jgi:hypothetical protein